jgi:hypothetical protein
VSPSSAGGVGYLLSSRFQHNASLLSYLAAAVQPHPPTKYQPEASRCVRVESESNTFLAYEVQVWLLLELFLFYTHIPF